ncbi:signal transduction histidine kinase [Desulfitobacterium dehalogenans ATCC 51507]|uniref:histidine kinase n=1 Tax=Desulfitobacterium dehalogenans (strain ATCC 51507 / DSM 9161 / JW/IU-DC1) TaxID=756499 RepID=I4A7P8_DESDJ|nr:HAMP domain-containing sensor histidine kinase [Desulfitobacterium dehalogenans]AFL99982.1 signal transduction histidine kinase [Desulfitobacterium dehalogenans ATCC 51507]
MKQRTFLTTLGLFLIFFNLGIFFVSNTMFRDTINRAEERSLGEHYFIASALIKDFRAVESRGTDVKSSITSLLQPYSYLSGDNKAGLALYREGQLIYSNKDAMIVQNNFLEPPENGNRLATVRKANDKTYVIVSGKLPLPYDSYTLVYLYDTTEGITAWNHLKNMLFLGGFVLSVLLALGLLLVLNRIFRPLTQISQTSRDIANGEYETRLTVSGQDELSEMAQSFNHMAEEIQRQMTELKDAADKKQQFVDNFAHELRTPLTAIYGYAEYMEKAVLSEEDRLLALNYIMSESRRLQTIASQLLAVANLQNNPIDWEELKVASLFEAVSQTLYGRLAGKDIKIEFIMEVGTLWGDAALLESLLINLIDNGIKACEKGGHIIVSAVMEGGRKVITVKDNGKGMIPEVLTQITEPFYRGEKSRNRSDGGTGLGLAICKQIALSHHAELSFTSRPGEGTTAKITFTTS